MKIVITGGAGLVGQNLVPRLKEKGYSDIVVLDKHEANLGILSELHPDIQVKCVNLSRDNSWNHYLDNAEIVVMLHAQIGGFNKVEFEENNILATEKVAEVMQQKKIKRVIHVSSSVVESNSSDLYTQTKRLQEEIVLAKEFSSVVLRPTLMFGWFDRKHLGWLSRFMKRVPIFPVPGNGTVIRQPLYAGDFANIIVSCVANDRISGVYDISGLEKVEYIEIIRLIRRYSGAKSLIVKVPVLLFSFLLKIWALFDSDPPFTADQLSALMANEEFAVLDWPGIFSVDATKFDVAVSETFEHPVFSKIVLEF